MENIDQHGMNCQHSPCKKYPYRDTIPLKLYGSSAASSPFRLRVSLSQFSGSALASLPFSLRFKNYISAFYMLLRASCLCDIFHQNPSLPLPLLLRYPLSMLLPDSAFSLYLVSCTQHILGEEKSRF